MANFERIFMITGILLQVITYILTDTTLLSLISGLCGIISVVLCSQRKLSFYWFGFIQLITYIVICFNEQLYAEIGENIFYFITMIYGLYHWTKHYDNNINEVKTRELKYKTKTATFIGMLFLTLILYNVLIYTNDSQPFMDAITTVPAFIAQILMILRYKESWHYWLIIDIGSIIMWTIAENWCMTTQFIFWTINCLYGLYKWNKIKNN